MDANHINSFVIYFCFPFFFLSQVLLTVDHVSLNSEEGGFYRGLD